MITALTAASTSASAHTITGSEPPSSNVIRFRSGAASPATWRPTAVEPVNATRRTSGCPTSASPITEPRPVTTLSTPSGNPASPNSRATSNVASGVVAAGLATTVLPDASAGRHLRAQQRQRKVVGGDRGTHAHRPTDHQPVRRPERRGQLLVGAADLGRGLGVEVDAVGQVGHLAHRLGERLALFGGQKWRPGRWRSLRSRQRPWPGPRLASRRRCATTRRRHAWPSRPRTRRRRATRPGRCRRPPRWRG